MVNECGLTRSFKHAGHDFLDFDKTEEQQKQQAELDLQLEIEHVRNQS